MSVTVKQVVLGVTPGEQTKINVRDLLSEAGIQAKQFEVDRKLLWEDNDGFEFEGTNEQEICLQGPDVCGKDSFDVTIYIYN